MLPAGTRLGPYELQSIVGSGGMGEVYRATDTRLNRTVAIKILSPELAGNPEFRARFEREARAISQLNHPHICTLYDVGENYLVMELIQGDTLAQLLERGALPMPRALEYAAQIADALDRAHRHGIVHGDLKPGNIMITRGGVKLLDFGLATEQRSAPAGWSDTDTHTAPVDSGAVLGTLQYLAPEQLEGQPSDARSDIFACGAVLYEMVTGRKAFEGTSHASVIAAIMREQPAPLRELVPAAPPALERLVNACLAKDPSDRWQNAGDLRRELQWMAPVAGGTEAARRGHPRRGRARYAWATAGIATVLALAAMAALLLRPAERQASAVRTSILLPDGVRFPAGTPAGGGGRVAVSPDGRQVAFVAIDQNGNQLLWLRSFDSGETRALAGTDGAASPFWSPDSRALAFVAQGQLKRVDVGGGMPSVIAAPAINTTGSWNADGIILFTPAGDAPVHRVPASGGAPQPVTRLDEGRSEVGHRNPIFLPDGRHFLFVAVGSLRDGESAPPRSVFAGSLDADDPVDLLVANASGSLYADGHLLFVRDATIFAQPFDPAGRTLSGEAQALPDQVEVSGAGAASLGVSVAGTLAYQPAASQGSQLAWFDRAGRQLGTLGEPGRYADVELSPDGMRAAVSLLDPATGTRDLWVIDVVRGVRTRFTFDRADDVAPIWSGDSQRILFTSNRAGRFDLYQRDANGVGPEERVLVDEEDKYPTSWSRDGKTILFWTFDLGGTNLRLLRPGDESGPRPFLAGVSPGRISPDGRWVAYYSNESGRSEVYVVPFPTPSRKWQVSNRGGSFVRWRGDGRELFYLSRDNRLMAVDIDTDSSDPQVGTERALFEARPVGARYFYAVSPDGQRLLVNTLRDGSASSSITVVQNWSAVLRSE